MIELGPENVIEYLHTTGRLASRISASVEWLAGGVSNVVLRIHPDVGDDFVVKQSREKLRTEANWFSRLDRVHRESALMQTLAPLLPAGAVPRVLFEDHENYLFAMEAVDADHVVWKAALLEGTIDMSVAETLGTYMSAIHARTANDVRLRDSWGDREVFIQLRVDPFYRRIVDVHPDLRIPIERMVEEMFDTAVCVVHADFSPKNILIAGERITLVDYETGHFGDPAFDLGFFLSHLMLKTALHASRCSEFLKLAMVFWNRYVQGLGEPPPAPPLAEDQLERRAIAHLAGCMLARIDGTSPVDYLPNRAQQDFVREFCRHLLLSPPRRLNELFRQLEEKLVERMRS